MVGFDLKEIITLATDKTTLYLGAYHLGTTDKFATTDTLVISNPQVIDLTLMFGTGYEPTTPEEFEALYQLPYYNNNPGTLINNAAEGVKTVGFNLWDEEWEVGTINDSDGLPASNSSYIRSKNYTPAFPSTEYYKTLGARIFYYDANKNYLGYTATNAAGTFTTPAGTRYLKIRINYASPYQNDICINLSDSSRNGTYEPHWESVLELGLGDIKVKSHNIWDEVWEQGNIANLTGQNDTTGTNRIRSKNYISVTPGGSYNVTNKSSVNVYIYYYASDKSFISAETSDYVSGNSNKIYTIPSNCYFIRFRTYDGYGTTYNHDICINLSDPAFNGRYEPYGDGGVISITGGLKSAGTVYDEISGGKLISRLGEEDMGNMTWLYRTEVTGGGVFSSTDLNRPGGSETRNANLISPKYTAEKGVTGVTLVRDKPDMTICDYSGNAAIVYVKNLAYTSATDFKAAMSGVPLYYELTTPIEYELYNPIDLSYKVDKFGTEKLLPESTSAIVSSPFRADIEYRTTNITIDDVYGGSDIIKSVEDVDSRLTTVEKSINGLVTTGSGSPTTIPKNIGDFYIDVTNKVLYFATGNQLISD